MVTMKDVARVAGVSISTVSLVLSGRGVGRITVEISDRVRAAAADLQYEPNLIAQGLRTRQTRTIGLLSDRVASTPFAGKMLASAQKEAWQSGYLMLLIDTAGDQAMEEPATRALLQRNVEGLIYASMYHRKVQLPKVPSKLPLVVLDGQPSSDQHADWIVPDERGGAEKAVNALISAGHRRIGFCNDGEPIPASAGRLQGYCDALNGAGIPFDPALVANATTNTAEPGRQTAHALLALEDSPTALFCFSDIMAAGAFRAAAERGLRIPEDLSIVGFDNQELVIDALTPGLTTVDLPHEQMGAWAARRIIARIQSSGEPAPPTHQLAPCELIERASIAAPRS